MTRPELVRTAELLEQRILAAGPNLRSQYQPELSSIVHRMEEIGLRVPGHLRQLDVVLTDEAIEDRFDNMPV
jgi:hypothetical protein